MKCGRPSSENAVDRLSGHLLPVCALPPTGQLAERFGLQEVHASPPTVTPLLLWEFRQSARFQAFRHSKNPEVGYPLAEAEKMISDLKDDLRAEVVICIEFDFTSLLFTGEQISKARTFAGGHRSFDLMHVATAIELDAKAFLSFDANQTRLAAAEGLGTPLAEA